jgi:hypothetical protein
VKSWTRFSENPKSRTCTELSRSIQNRKGLGFSVIAFVLTVIGAVASAQQPKKARGYGIYRLSSATAASESTVPRLFGWLWGDLGYIEGQNRHGVLLLPRGKKLCAS